MKKLLEITCNSDDIVCSHAVNQINYHALVDKLTLQQGGKWMTCLTVAKDLTSNTPKWITPLFSEFSHTWNASSNCITKSNNILTSMCRLTGVVIVSIRKRAVLVQIYGREAVLDKPLVIMSVLQVWIPLFPSYQMSYTHIPALQKLDTHELCQQQIFPNRHSNSC